MYYEIKGDSIYVETHIIKYHVTIKNFIKHYFSDPNWRDFDCYLEDEPSYEMLCVIHDELLEKGFLLPYLRFDK